MNKKSCQSPYDFQWQLFLFFETTRTYPSLLVLTQHTNFPYHLKRKSLSCTENPFKKRFLLSTRIHDILYYTHTTDIKTSCCSQQAAFQALYTLQARRLGLINRSSRGQYGLPRKREIEGRGLSLLLHISRKYTICLCSGKLNGQAMNHKVHIYKEYHIVGPLVGIGQLSGQTHLPLFLLYPYMYLVVRGGGPHGTQSLYF